MFVTGDPKETERRKRSAYKIAIVAPTPFYYQVAIFRELANHPRIELTVYFCSDEALNSRDILKTYKTDRRWGVDEELLEGYPYKFLKNYSPMPSYLRWPFGLMNPAIWNEIKNERPDFVILMSWMNPTWWIAILACVRFKIPFIYMTDSNVQAELGKSWWLAWPKKVLLGRIVFPLASGFLCAGTSNKLMYGYYNVPDKKLFPFAFSWGYETLMKTGAQLVRRRKEIRAQLRIPQESFVVLFSGRLSKEKDPFNLLEAFHNIDVPDKALVIVGDGKLRQTMQDYVARNDVNSVFFFGFQNRLEIAKFYALADVLVLPSLQETWGIVVNEALCFGLPVISSDQVGAHPDLVLPGSSGFVFPAGDAEALTSAIKQVADMPRNETRAMRIRAEGLIKEWSQRRLGEILSQHLDTILAREAAKT